MINYLFKDTNPEGKYWHDMYKKNFLHAFLHFLPEDMV